MKFVFQRAMDTVLLKACYKHPLAQFMFQQLRYHEEGQDWLCGPITFTICTTLRIAQPFRFRDCPSPHRQEPTSGVR